MRTMRKFEKADSVGFFIENLFFLMRCGHLDCKQVIAVEEMVAKIKAATDTRIDKNFVSWRGKNPDIRG